MELFRKSPEQRRDAYLRLVVERYQQFSFNDETQVCVSTSANWLSKQPQCQSACTCEAGANSAYRKLRGSLTAVNFGISAARIALTGNHKPIKLSPDRNSGGIQSGNLIFVVHRRSWLKQVSLVKGSTGPWNLRAALFNLQSIFLRKYTRQCFLSSRSNFKPFFMDTLY